MHCVLNTRVCETTYTWDSNYLVPYLQQPMKAKKPTAKSCLRSRSAGRHGCKWWTKLLLLCRAEDPTLQKKNPHNPSIIWTGVLVLLFSSNSKTLIKWQQDPFLRSSTHNSRMLKESGNQKGHTRTWSSAIKARGMCYRKAKKNLLGQWMQNHRMAQRLEGTLRTTRCQPLCWAGCPPSTSTGQPTWAAVPPGMGHPQLYGERVPAPRHPHHTGRKVGCIAQF